MSKYEERCSGTSKSRSNTVNNYGTVDELSASPKSSRHSRSDSKAVKHEREHERERHKTYKRDVDTHQYYDSHSSRKDRTRERDSSRRSSAQRRTDTSHTGLKEEVLLSSSHDRAACHNMVSSSKAQGEQSQIKTEFKQLDDHKMTPDVDWKSHRRILDDIFFRDIDVIKRGTAEYDDFWPFLEKYEAFQRKHSMRQLTDKSMSRVLQEPKSSMNEKFDLPKQYDKRYRINISLLNRDDGKSVYKSGGMRDRSCDNLTPEQLSSFNGILLHYLDFLQKQKFNRLAKIRRDQQNLPIYVHRDEIVEAVAKHQVVVVAGDTGCGKSTQVPQYLLAAGYTRIACTQPRRIACISLSRRVAYETLNEYGSEVAYQVRFERSRTRSTRILFLTEGLLLRQIESDPMLSQYSVLVIDEVHERHIHTDFLLGVVKCILAQRSDLKLVLMSATININLFSGYFDDAPVCCVPGRLYPIQVIYQPVESGQSSIGGKSERFDPSPYIRVLQAIDYKYPVKERGDVLIFLSGMSDIMAVVEAAKDYASKSKSWIILALHSALSIAEQDKVFDFPPEGVRKCIISTNIAETSVTIDGVRFVVDSGKVKEMSFDTTYKMQKLQEFWISRASAEQRKGRAGRTGPGVCYRLYAESDYDALQEYSTPEIRRVPLDSLVLQMIAMGLPDARRFPFIEPPPTSTIETSISFLKDQGALSVDETLTTIGQMLAQLPVDVVIGKMLIMASVFDMIDVVLSVAASLCVQSVFTARAQRDYDACALRKSLESDHGDPLTLLNAFDAWVATKAEGGDSRKWCRRRGLEEQRFYEITKLKQQFHGLLTQHGLLRKVGLSEDDSEGENGDNETAESGLTAVERRRRHADKRRLTQLRREQKRQVKKRKILRPDDDNWNLASDEERDDGNLADEALDIDSNIRDLEFRLTNEIGQLSEQVIASRRMALKDVTLLKVVLCSGLYPQVAIADEHNSFKRESDHVYHTRNKGFVLLHPNTVFATIPESLQLKESQIKEPKVIGGSRPAHRGHLSNGHQLVAFVSLVETTKPYLLNVMRVPALQTTLLFAQSIDTNSDCSRIVCDEWLEMTLENAEDGESILSAAVRLRAAWQQLLHLKLKSSGPRKGIEEGASKRRFRIEHLQSVLYTKLAEFLHSSVYYYIRRIHAAEQSHLYIGCVDTSDDSANNVLNELLLGGGKPHPTKGGTLVAGGYLVYNCLQDDATSSVWGEYTSCMQRHWTCSRCERSFVVTLGERLDHEQRCETEQLEQNADTIQREAEQRIEKDRFDALRKSYSCSICGRDFHFTTAEILRHKKSCKSTDN